MRDVIFVKLDNVNPVTKLNYFTKKKKKSGTGKSKVIISLLETVILSVSDSPRNVYNSLKSIKKNPSNKFAGVE